MSTQIIIELGSEYAEGNIADAILNRAASELLKMERPLRDELENRVRQIRDEVIRQQVTPIVADALDAPIQPTDGYGSPRGPAVPLRQVILDVAAGQFNVRDRSTLRDKTALERFISEEVERVFRKELGLAMAGAREQVLAAVRGEGAKIIEETITRLARS